jgi:phenylalanyl-tRNA synthetase alpha chain
MKQKEIATQLHENELKILNALGDVGAATTEKIARITGLGKDAVEKASDWAATKGVVVFNQKVSQFFSITVEGKVYSENGLPEKNLLDLLKSGPKAINDLEKSFLELNIALAWVRRNGWADIQKGVISITDYGKSVGETLEEKIIAKLKEGGKVNAKEFGKIEIDVLEQLIKRKLVKELETVTRIVAITDFGKKVLPELVFIESDRVITQLTPDMLLTDSWKGARFQTYDITLPVPRTQPGKRHFISQVIDYIRRFWVELGFKEMKGEYLELNFWNFDALYQPQDHPARDLADTFYMKTPYKGHLPDHEIVERVKLTHENGWTTGSKGWQYDWDPEYAARTVLRTHTTSLSVNQIAKLKPEDLPGKFFSVGRVFRNETIDWNHLAEFYQTDGIVIGEGVTFRDMKGYLKAYMEGLGVERFRFRPGYFPYTEMSMEAEVWIDERGEWMELFGAGMFRPEVVKPLIGVDIPVLAWGPGFDRLVMQSYKVDTIKELYSNDIGLLRRAKMWTR